MHFNQRLNEFLVPTRKNEGVEIAPVRNACNLVDIEMHCGFAPHLVGAIEEKIAITGCVTHPICGCAERKQRLCDEQVA